MPRTQLRRHVGAVAKTRTTRLAAVLGLTALALAAITAAVSSPSVFWPTVVPGGVVRFGVTHLGPLGRLAYLAHLSGAPRSACRPAVSCTVVSCTAVSSRWYPAQWFLHSGFLRHFH